MIDRCYSPRPVFPRKLQRGVALITALLIASIATALVATMFWRQWTAIQTEQSLRTLSQAQWLIRGGIDWAELILDEDARTTAAVDHLGEIWAVKLARTSLAEFLNQTNPSQSEELLKANEETQQIHAWLSGEIKDAQARFNLRNILFPASVPAADQETLKLLCEQIQTDGSCKDLLDELRNFGPRQPSPVNNESPTKPTPAPVNPQDLPPVLAVKQLDDLITLMPEKWQDTMQKMAPNLVLLPQTTQVNINTANEDVIAALLAIPAAQARRVVVARDNAYFKYPQDLRTVFPERVVSVNEARVSVNSRFFELHATIQVDDFDFSLTAMLSRTNGRTTLIAMNQP